MMWLTTVLQIILFSQLAGTSPRWTWVPLSYFGWSIEHQDFYFDRIVPLVLNVKETPERPQLLGIGVLITSDRILTSFNPFRRMMSNKTLLSELYASVLVGREKYADSPKSWMYNTRHFHIACGRQIQDLPDDEISQGNLWHGMGKRHCPLHDLLVFRIDGSVKETTMTLADNHLELYPEGEDTVIMFNEAFFTRLAKPFEMMSSHFKLGTVLNRRSLYAIYYRHVNAVVDCDDWLPRDWGHFICILKYDDLEVPSGATLVSNEKLFGVASFVLSRGPQSIIVFTDVRPYDELINNTCTKADSDEMPAAVKPYPAQRPYS